MMKIALVGNIASGKSTVEKTLQELNFAVLDTDFVAHCLLENNAEIMEAFKDYDILTEGKISREKLGKIVFSDETLKQKLEAILHPQIRAKIQEYFSIHSNEKLVFVSIPLLFEAKMEDLFDRVLFVYTNDDIRLQRLMKRNNYTKEYAIVRMNSQISQDEKVKLADWVIYNNSTVEDLRKMVVNVIEQIH